MKITTVLVLVVVLGLIGMVVLNQGKVNTMIADRVGHTEVCVRGVSYVVFPNGTSVQYNPDGSIRTCN